MRRVLCENILEAVGNTPLVRINRIIKNAKIEIYAKLEFMNPMGSIKDRTAKYMIEQAEKDGRLKKGDLIIENSSGNTALGLALIAIQKGYRLKVVVRDSISPDKINLLKSLGVEILQADSKLPPESPDSYNNITPRIVKENPGCYFPDQHNNWENNDAHYYTTAPEIWEQAEGRIDYFIAGMGTGGTLGGVAKYLKEKDPSIKVIGVDVEGSVFYDYFKTGKIIKPQPYLVEGLGDEFLIECADFTHIDDMIRVSDRDAFLTARRLLKEEGVMAGGSSGATFFGVVKIVENLKKNARIVTIFPDSSSRYYSTIFNDEWMKEKGFL